MNNKFFLSLLIMLLGCSYAFSQSFELSDIGKRSEDGRWIYFNKGQNLQANTLMQTHGYFFGLGQSDEVRLIKSQTDEIGLRHDKYQLFHKGIEVEHAIWIVHSRDNYPYTANGFLPLPLQSNLGTTALINEKEALEKALEHLGEGEYAWEDKGMEDMIKLSTQDPAATYYPKAELLFTDSDFEFDNFQARLAYKFEILRLSPLANTLLYIDALDGSVIKELDNLHTTHETGVAETAYSGSQLITTEKTSDGYRLREANRNGGASIWTLDANNNTNLGNATDFVDDDNVWDSFEEEKNRAATDAHFMAQFTHDYFQNTFQREGYDGEGGLVLSYMHYGDPNFFNAFFSPSGRFMAYGDGNGEPLSTPDIFAHEFVHGVTFTSAGLIYANESGALNESFSDIFGNTVEYLVDPQKFTWYVGEEIGAFRNMANPNEYGDPKMYNGRFWFPGAGVHTNSGVQNYWYYLLVEGGQGFDELGRPINVKGIGFEKAMQIAYRNLTVYLTPTSTYQDAKNGAIEAVTDIFGECSPEFIAVANAWNTVGISSAALPNDFSLESFSEFEICDEFDNKEITFNITYTGCDTFQGGRMNFEYLIADYGIKLEEETVLPSLGPREAFTYTFTETVDIPEPGRFLSKGSVSIEGDPFTFNNAVFRRQNKTARLKAVEKFPFSSGSTLGSVTDTIDIVSGLESNVRVSSKFGRNANGGLSIEGGKLETYLLSDTLDPFEINPEHVSSLSMCVDATRSLDLTLYFDLKQVFSSYVEETFSVGPEVAGPVVNSLKLKVNGEEIARFSPINHESDTFSRETIELNAYAGTQFSMSFEAVLHQSDEVDTVGQGDRVFLDNIEFQGLKKSPQVGGVKGAEGQISYWYYPNPTSGNLTLAFESADESNYQVELLDLTGRLLLQRKIMALAGVNDLKLNLSNLAEGLYLLRIRNGEKEEVSKILKE